MKVILTFRIGSFRGQTMATIYGYRSVIVFKLPAAQCQRVPAMAMRYIFNLCPIGLLPNHHLHFFTLRNDILNTHTQIIKTALL